MASVAPQTPVKKTTKSRKTPNLFKHINAFDAFKSYYVRFAFSAPSLEQINSIFDSLYKEKVIDWSYVHAYKKERFDGYKNNTYYVAHGLARSTDEKKFGFNFFRSRLPKACIKTSFYPEGTYPKMQKPVQITETKVEAEGEVPQTTEMIETDMVQIMEDRSQ